MKMKRPTISIEYWNYKLVVANRSIGCDGTGYGNMFEKLGRSCEQCPIRFRCLTTNDTIVVETTEEMDRIVDFIQGR